MKKILIMTLTLIVLSLSSFGEVTHSKCKDSTYAYNQMQVTQTDDEILVELRGATIFQVRDNWDPRETTIRIDKSLCSISEDKLLFDCLWIDSINVQTRSTMFGDRDLKTLELKSFSLSLKKLSRANGYSFLILDSDYVINGDDQRTNNHSVLFEINEDNECRS